MTNLKKEVKNLMEGTKDIFLAFLEYEEGIYDRRNFIDAPEIGKTYVAFLDLTGALIYEEIHTMHHFLKEKNK
jgi:hypothetical protein